MTRSALFIRHRAKPGRRDDVRRVWDKWVRPRVESNTAHQAYFFCLDDEDPDRISVFQTYTDKDAVKAFMAGDWYPQYLAEVGEVVAAPPVISPATVVWTK